MRDGRLADRRLLETGRLARALAALNGDGEETRLVGGAVRDLALGEAVGDFDLATTALPEVVMKRARAAGFGVAPTGLAHGTVTLIVEGRPIEATTLRRDVDTDGRHAKVAFGRDFRDDALRRDFTINALSLTADGTVHDYVGGLADLADRRVRFIGEARQRIREDYLRILRFFRFSARYGDGRLDRAGFDAAIAEREGLAILSRERVRAELMKLVRRAARAASARRDLRSGAASAAGRRPDRFGALRPPRGDRGGVTTRRPTRCCASARSACGSRRIPSGCANGCASPTPRPSGWRSLARGLADLHDGESPPGLGALRRLLFERRRQGALDALALFHADSGAPADDWRFARARAFLSATPEPTLADHRRRRRRARRHSRPARRRDAEEAAGLVDPRRFPARARGAGAAARRGAEAVSRLAAASGRG